MKAKLEILKFIIAVAIVTGYVKNILHLMDCDFKASYKAEIIYSLGAISGLGAVTGYIDFGK